ncbi:hypothetical protein U27_00486 [Candidatus Vecturithrix granuli]|uniref:Uncharacterized protein n=1 Tax=Vecturithrix granuli TaxID=1499967 RepID=A0A081C7N4_VECG1|nr:hypothetical protein U27_00486 [Candidatus Vecturithrix granuli]
MFYAVFIGAVAAVLYVLGFIAGGSFGASCAMFGAKIMKTGIPISALGSCIGMLGFYIEGTHELTMNQKHQETTD